MSTPLLTFDDVSKRYHEGTGERRVLEHVRASFSGGELVTLLGRSGSGKSTLLHLASGLDVPTEGEVHLLGNPLSQRSESERTRLRRAQVGFVFQAFNLLPTLTVEENVLLPLELVGRRGQQARLRCKHLLEQVGLADRSRAFPDTLSGGEQQRIAVARAISHEPSLVLADEPTGNLDDASAESVMNLLGALARDPKRLVLVVTHDTRWSSVATRTMHLESGHLA